MRLFTKSAFKQALFCPASLYYYYDRDHYANQMNEDDFLQALADGGNQVGDLAKVYYDVKPDADIRSLGYGESLEKTCELMKRGEVNIAEAACGAVPKDEIPVDLRGSFREVSGLSIRETLRSESPSGMECCRLFVKKWCEALSQD